MNAVLERFCRKLVVLDWNIFAMDADKWITVHPNGSEGKGRPALIDGETGRVKGGRGEPDHWEIDGEIIQPEASNG